MKVIDIIHNTKHPFFSFEIIPPLRGGNIHKLYESIEPLIHLAPPFINITFHRDEVEYRQATDGSIRKITVTKRPGSVALAAAIMKRYPVEVVPHLVCGGATAHQLENDLIDLNFLDIENVMALRGDAIPGERYFTPEPGGYAHSRDLVRQIKRLNQGIYLDDTLTNAVATNFCIGVAGYPEKHHEAPNATSDIEYLKQKIDAGADYIVTQMFYDNRKYFTFVEKCRAQGIEVPIIPGLKPISTSKHLDTLPRSFNIDIPEELERAIRHCKSPMEIKQLGIEWCVQHSLELLDQGAPAIHYYSMGKSDNIQEIVKRVF